MDVKSAFMNGNMEEVYVKPKASKPYLYIRQGSLWDEARSPSMVCCSFSVLINKFTRESIDNTLFTR